jgi:hypothetical protein
MTEIQAHTFDIPAEVAAVFNEFRTTEFTTIGKDGTPATWPVTAVFRPEGCEFIVATSIGLSQKAVNVGRNPRVSLLFSEPGASGLTSPPAVLVQGDAVAEPITTLDGIEDLWEKIYRFQPSAKWTTWGPLMKQMMGKWYYVRIPLRITPTRILWWPDADFSNEPLVVPHVG